MNALIFAVLAASIALAYYGYSYTSDRRDREQRLLQDLAKEKVLNIEALIAEQDTKLMRGVQIAPMSNFRDLIQTSGAAVSSVFVLDDKRELLPGGYHTNGPTHDKDNDAFRGWFMAHVAKVLQLDLLPTDTRGHLYAYWGKTAFMFSWMKRTTGGRTFYVVIEDDLNYFVYTLFRQFFSVTTSPRLYEVVDDRHIHVYGTPFLNIEDQLVVEEPFVDTVDGWELRVTDRDDAGLRQRTLLSSLVIGVAVLVIVASLGFLAIAIWRERRANDLKSEFISNVSHELKTPLSIISMFGEMLALGRTKGPAQSTEYAEIIWRESVRLGRLIDNVLDFAKIERGMGVYEFAEADVGEVVDRVVELSQRRLAAAEMTLETHIEPDLPVAPLDANAFTLAALNLIDNAIKYAAEGKRIELKVGHTRDRITLSVRDWGPGIDPAEHDKIFDRFYRARAIRLKPIRGSGIGLALVQHIARAHKGDVTVKSEVGKGSTFTIWLPAGTLPP